MSAPDLSEFNAENTPSPKQCVVATFLENLDEDRRRNVQAALDARHIKHTAIARVVKRWGIPVSTNAIGRHRAGGCCCGR